MNFHKKNIYSILFLFTMIIGLYTFFHPASVPEAAAQSTRILPECAVTDGNCELDDFIQLFVNLADWGLKVLPALSMFFFIIGGFYLLISGGSAEKIQKGKKVLSSVLIGTIIVLVFAWAWSAFIYATLTDSDDMSAAKVFGVDWWGGEPYRNPDAGCCILSTGGGDFIGCQDNLTAYECQGLSESIPESSYYEPYPKDSCSQLTDCSTYTEGCCVPNNQGNSCYAASSGSGCIDFPGTHYEAGACNTVPSCGEGGFGNEPGCCIIQDSCFEALFSADCPGDFREGVNCIDDGICLSGTCITESGCTSGGIDCEGEWSDLPIDDPAIEQQCLGGCCETINSCYNETYYRCEQRSDIQSWTSPGSCATVAGCIANGCCVYDSSCIGGPLEKIGCEGNWRTNDCSIVPACLPGCCQDTDSTCYQVDHGYECDFPSQYHQGGNCGSLPGVCNTCCVYTDHCEANESEATCAFNSGSFFLGTCPTPCP